MKAQELGSPEKDYSIDACYVNTTEGVHHFKLAIWI
jgi:hypothetical protein